MDRHGASIGGAAVGMLAGMAVGAAAAYAMSGDAALLRRNMRRVERGTHRAIRQIEHCMH